MSGDYRYDIDLGSSGLGNITRIENIADRYISRLDRLINYNNELKKQLANASEEVGKPFIKETELERKLQKQSQLAFELELGKANDVIIDSSQGEKINESTEKSTGNLIGIAAKIVAAKEKAALQEFNTPSPKFEQPTI